MSYGWNELMKLADEAGFTPLPIGTYDVYVATAEPKRTNSNKDSYVVQFRVLHGPCQGRPIRNQFTISPDNAQALGFFFRNMAALGIPREYFAAEPAPEAICAALLNRQCRIEVNHREFPPGSGEMRDNVAKIMPIPGGVASATPQPSVPTPTVPAPAPAPAPVAPPTPPVAQPPVSPPPAPTPPPLPAPAPLPTAQPPAPPAPPILEPTPFNIPTPPNAPDIPI